MLIQPILCYDKSHKNEINTCKERYSTQMQNTGGNRGIMQENCANTTKKQQSLLSIAVYRHAKIKKDLRHTVRYCYLFRKGAHLVLYDCEFCGKVMLSMLFNLHIYKIKKSRYNQINTKNNFTCTAVVMALLRKQVMLLTTKQKEIKNSVGTGPPIEGLESSPS